MHGKYSTLISQNNTKIVHSVYQWCSTTTVCVQTRKKNCGHTRNEVLKGLNLAFFYIYSPPTPLRPQGGGSPGRDSNPGRNLSFTHGKLPEVKTFYYNLHKNNKYVKPQMCFFNNRP